MKELQIALISFSIVLCFLSLYYTVNVNYKVDSTNFFEVSPEIVSNILEIPPHPQPPQKQLFPRVYIHYLPPQYNKLLLQGRERIPTNGPLSAGDHHWSDSPFVYNTHQYSNAVMLHKRLGQSRYRVMNASEADYIFLPYYAGLDYKNQDKQFVDLFGRNKQFLEIPAIELGSKPFLVYSCLHGLYARKGFTNTFYRQNVLTIDQNSIEKDVRHRTDKNTALHFQVPYASFVHVPKQSLMEDAPWQDFRKTPIVAKRFLASFIGSVTTKFAGATNFARRKKLKHVMDRHGSMSFIETKRNGTIFGYKETVELYSNSLFCPHLGGDSCHRKAFYDTLLLGCIPVVFEELECNWPMQETINFDELVVKTSFEKAVEQKQLGEILRQLSSEKVQKIRENIARHARVLQSSLFDDDQDMFAYILKESLKLRPLFN